MLLAGPAPIKLSACAMMSPCDTTLYEEKRGPRSAWQKRGQPAVIGTVVITDLF